MTDQEAPEEKTEETETLRSQLKREEEEEVVSGLLRFHVGARTVEVPELKWRADREWQKQYIAAQTQLATSLAITGDQQETVLTAEGQQAVEDAQLELIRAYDQTHALGDLEDATWPEINAIYDRIVEVAFPLAGSHDAASVTIIQRAVEAIKSRAASSTSGPSPTGTSAAPMILKPRLRTARSSSSTRKRKSA